MARKRIKREVRKVGNGATKSLHKADLDNLGMGIESVVNHTVSTADDSYTRTRASSRRMRGRYAQTLKILGQ